MTETMKLVEDDASMNAIQIGILTSSPKERLEALEEQRKAAAHRLHIYSNQVDARAQECGHRTRVYREDVI